MNMYYLLTFADLYENQSRLEILSLACYSVLILYVPESSSTFLTFFCGYTILEAGLKRRPNVLKTF